MLYSKNLPVIERVLRVLIGLGIAVAGFLWLTGWLTYAAMAAGAGFALTGFIGFCPMCAMAGRRLDKR